MHFLTTALSVFLATTPPASQKSGAADEPSFAGVKLGATQAEALAALKKQGFTDVVDADAATWNGKKHSQTELVGKLEAAKADSTRAFEPCTVMRSPDDLPPSERILTDIVCVAKSGAKSAIQAISVTLFEDRVYGLLVTFQPKLADEAYENVVGKFGAKALVEKYGIDAVAASPWSEKRCRTRTCQPRTWRDSFGREVLVTGLVDVTNAAEPGMLELVVRDMKTSSRVLGLLADKRLSRSGRKVRGLKE